MKTLMHLVLCLMCVCAYGQFKKKPVAKTEYSVTVFLPAFEPQFVTAARPITASLTPTSFPTDHAVNTNMGYTFSQYNRQGRLILYTFDQFGNFTGSSITLVDHHDRRHRRFRR